MQSNRQDALKTAAEISEYVRPPAKALEPHWPAKGAMSPNTIHQADLLFMPRDMVDGKEYRYILAIVDVGTRLIAARPLENKASEYVAKVLDSMYSDELEKPVVFQVDAGSEFKGDVSELFKKMGVKIRRAQPNRHTQQAIVEGNNRVLAKYLFHEMLADEVQSGETSRRWVDRLPKYVEMINKNRQLMKDHAPVSDDSGPMAPPGQVIEVLPEGAIVRYALDYPIDYVSKKKTDGKFRIGDVRWSEPTKISLVLLKPGSPPRYVVEGRKGVSYTRNQLKLID